MFLKVKNISFRNKISININTQIHKSLKTRKKMFQFSFTIYLVERKSPSFIIITFSFHMLVS